VMACLAKDPADRPQSPRELSLRLAEIEGPDAWTQERAGKWWEAHWLSGGGLQVLAPQGGAAR